jgi:hypothetical protein
MPIRRHESTEMELADIRVAAPMFTQIGVTG